MKELLEAGKVTPVTDRHFRLRDVADAIRYLEPGVRQWYWKWRRTDNVRWYPLYQIPVRALHITAALWLPNGLYLGQLGVNLVLCLGGYDHYACA